MIFSKTRSQNTKPYIYAAFPQVEDESVSKILKSLGDDGVELCCIGSVGRREEKKIEAACGVLLFATNEYSKSDIFHKIVDNAVKYGKRILCIYMDAVQQTPWLSMQLGSQLALFKDNYKDIDSLIEKVKQAQIFQNMSVTDAQKRFQRNRGLAMIGIPIVAACILYFAVVGPLLIEPAITKSNVLQQMGLSKSDLEKVKEIHIIGNKTFDDYVHAWYDPQDHSMVYYDLNENGNMVHQDAISTGSLASEDLSILKDMPNLITVEIEGQQITDLKSLPKLNVENVRFNCNPITSLEGIENFDKLRFISVTDTYVSDISPLLELEQLDTIQINGCPVSDISGIEKMPNLNSILISDTKVSSIPKLGPIDNLTLDVRNLRIYDWSFMSEVKSICQLQINAMGDCMEPDDVIPYLKDKPIQKISWSGIRSLNDIKNLNITEGGYLSIPNNYLTSLDGIESFEGIESIDLFHHQGDPITLTDFTPLLKLNSLKNVSLSPDMQQMAKDQLKDAQFYINYSWG